MGASFFNTRNDKELLAASANFSTMISATPTAFGLVAAQATAYATLQGAFATACQAISSKGNKSPTLVANKNDARRALKLAASNLAGIIKSTPSVSDGQKLALGISVRATPTPAPAPGTPTDFKVELGNAGSLTLTWKCKNPKNTAGTTYNVFRRTTATGEFAYLGGSGEKKFVDTSIPTGTSSLTYQIQAIRSTGAGPWVQVNVNFSGGMVVQSVEDEAVMRRAA